ncbi:hypothetical protein GCM10011386_29040 [Parapedobacter defluvii]|uniref:DUF4595 domain-containing protein n=1 Tax=Parapedobacter defluvii TaxID=2045106 RepID=A0ABQ1M5K3_9SPHI|nr:hypothetical protein [Parapedobacter defluvii]GGC35097.1 hypothetical protein GCM10011386_29040 [Parapedobacter defluvii]
MYKRNRLWKTCSWICSILLCTTACKKDKEDTENKLPALGTCESVAPRLGLTLVEEGTYRYKSAGGAIIDIKRKSKESLLITLSYESYPNFTYEFWGDADPGDLGPASHENLNGKHVKDRVGTNRSVIFPDGTKMTYVSTAPWYMGGITAISIYDGAIVQHLNMTCFTWEYSAADDFFAKQLDAIQPDGETSTFELTETGLIFYNTYTEDMPGNKVYERVDIGSLAKDNPNQVNDFYDDTRLGHT